MLFIDIGFNNIRTHTIYTYFTIYCTSSLKYKYFLENLDIYVKSYTIRYNYTKN